MYIKNTTQYIAVFRRHSTCKKIRIIQHTQAKDRYASASTSFTGKMIGITYINSFKPPLHSDRIISPYYDVTSGIPCSLNSWKAQGHPAWIVYTGSKTLGFFRRKRSATYQYEDRKSTRR